MPWDDAAMVEVKTIQQAAPLPPLLKGAPRGQFSSQDYSSVFWGASTTPPIGEMWGRATRVCPALFAAEICMLVEELH